jgi:hypothetical protein
LDSQADVSVAVADRVRHELSGQEPGPPTFNEPS